MFNYLIVLFKNRIKKKIIKKFITLKKATEYYDKLLKESNEVIFNVSMQNGEDCNYEIGMVENSSRQLVPVYITDEMGRNVKVKLEEKDLTLFKINTYKVEEEIYDLQTKKKINTKEIIRRYIKNEGIKMISSLNNKIIIQNDEDYYLFSLKSESETSRFIDCLSNYFLKIKRGDCIFVKDTSNAQRKYLLSILESKGIDKKILYRKFTTHPRRKSK